MDAQNSFCVNCGSAGGSMMLSNEEILRCIQEWTAPRLVGPQDLVCTVCWSEAMEKTETQCNVGQNCMLCKNPLPKRSHQIIALRTDTAHHRNVKNIILERLIPLEVRASHFICHPCWQKADRAAKHYSQPSSSRNAVNELKCANCGINLIRMKRHILHDEYLLGLVQQRVAPRVVTANDYVCDGCHLILNQRDVTEAPLASVLEIESEPSVGHQYVCVKCGCSLLHQQSHTMEEATAQHVLDIIQNWIHPREVQPSDIICDTCFRRAKSRAEAQINQENNDEITNNQPRRSAETIYLPNYCRAPDTHAVCIFPHCTSTSQHVVPFIVRVRLFSDNKYYIPPNCRICDFHLYAEPWTELLETENQNHSFTASYIEDFCELLKHDGNIIDFDNIDRINNNAFRYWTGRTKDQFRELEAELPYFEKRSIALGSYLIKLRTGDSDERIAKLLDMSRSTLTKLVNKARYFMEQHFVPAQLGLAHITRTEVAGRNLYIPESLFGNPGSAIEDRKAIVIMDGTYIYVQKSSNYSYQKDTYSLHKFRNLVKPFLIVCCDGHIVDVLGPYPATKSDAEILKDEFIDPSKPMRQFFRDGDVIILDRGFRDAIPLLQSLNYEIHYPLTLQHGQTQMSTQDANESRQVTLCRWVVEVVNGRFKRDFKLLRQEYFNKASKHLMLDFKVAAALINRFHPLLVDRDDAGDIVSIVQERLFTNNILADYVERHNLNRRWSQFHSLTVNEDNFQDFPRMEISDLILISLGIYQIKQARSYYGEHIRRDGNYVIEVCRGVGQDLLEGLIENNNLENIWLLRGKIQSRHISRKLYFVYILIDNTRMGREAIIQYCCNCIVGRRTIGCCAHVMTILWYLSWGRYQEHLDPPAQFLDDILLRNIDD